MKDRKVILSLIMILSLMISAVSCGGPSPEELYSSIQQQINKADELESNYFAQFIDTKDLDAAKASAEKALSSSDEDSYSDVLDELTAQNEKISEAIGIESEKYYSSPTTEDFSYEYPFEVLEKDIVDRMLTGFMEPVDKQSSKFPTEIILNEAETTDTKDVMQYDDVQYTWDPEYEFKNIETKEVTVKIGGEEKTALVNTEMDLTPTSGSMPSEFTAKAYYFVKDKDGAITLLVPDMEGGDFYVPYQ